MNFDDKIIIIGAGISGITAAIALKKKGYTNVIILEKNDYVGGKCKTIEYEGKNYETGVLYVTQGAENFYNYLISIGVELDTVIYSWKKFNNYMLMTHPTYEDIKEEPDSETTFDYCSRINNIPFFYFLNYYAVSYGYKNVFNVLVKELKKILKYMKGFRHYYPITGFKEVFKKICDTEKIEINLSEVVTAINKSNKRIDTSRSTYSYDYLIITGIANPEFYHPDITDNLNYDKSTVVIIETEKEMILNSAIPDINLPESFPISGGLVLDTHIGYIHFTNHDNRTEQEYSNIIEETITTLGNFKILSIHNWTHNISFNNEFNPQPLQGIDDIYYINGAFNYDVTGACYDYANELVEQYF